MPFDPLDITGAADQIDSFASEQPRGIQRGLERAAALLRGVDFDTDTLSKIPDDRGFSVLVTPVSIDGTHIGEVNTKINVVLSDAGPVLEVESNFVPVGADNPYSEEF